MDDDAYTYGVCCGYGGVSLYPAFGDAPIFGGAAYGPAFSKPKIKQKLNHFVSKTIILK